MKTECTATVTIPEDEPDPYPYPNWSPDEIEKLTRWYPAIGLKQCVELWHLLTGRERSAEQLGNKSSRLGLQNYIPDDWLELFDGT